MERLTKRKKIGLVLAILILVVTFLVPVPVGLTVAGIRTLGCTLALLVVLNTGAMPIGLTAIIFMMLLFLLGATDSLASATSGMAAPLVMFIIASFGMSEAVSDTSIFKRLLHFMLKLFGTSVKTTLLGLMFATAIVSAFISNVPVTAMFVSIGISFIKLYEDENDRKQTGRTYMIGIPVAAMIGGIMTPVGSSPNFLAITMLENMLDYKITFVEWAAYGVPIALVMLVLSWFLITKVFPPVEMDRQLFEQFMKSTEVDGKTSRQEKKMMIIFAIMIILWILSSWIKGINLYAVGVAGVCIMFLPGINILEWERFKKAVKWDIIFLTAAVISLGNIINENGLSSWFVNALFPDNLNYGMFVIVFVTAIFVIIMLLIIPVPGASIQILSGPLIILAANAGISPVILIITLCFCATNCYMFPIDPVPLIAYSSGYFKMSDMPKATAPILIVLALLCALWCPVVSVFISTI